MIQSVRTFDDIVPVCKVITSRRVASRRFASCYAGALGPTAIRPGLADYAPAANVQFERLGYFVAEQPVFNRTVALRDTGAKIEAKS